MDRRALLSSVGASTAALLLGRLSARAQNVAAEQRRAASGAMPGALFTFDSGEAGFFTRTHFYDTGQEAVAFDAQFTPDLSHTSTDTALVAAVLILGGADQIPVS